MDVRPSAGRTTLIDTTRSATSAATLQSVHTVWTDWTVLNRRSQGAKSSAANGGYVNRRLVFGSPKE